MSDYVRKVPTNLVLFSDRICGCCLLRVLELNAQGDPAPVDPGIFPIKEHAVSDVLSLLERSQQSPVILGEIEARGLSDSLRGVCSMYLVVELVCDMSISLVAGDQFGCSLQGTAFQKYKEKLLFIQDFVAEDEVSGVAEDADIKSKIVDLVSFEAVSGIFSKLGVPLTKDIRIGKKALRSAQQRAVEKHKKQKKSHNARAWSNEVDAANPSSRSTTIPNKGEQMHLSTSRTELAWDSQLWGEWVSSAFSLSQVDVLAPSVPVWGVNQDSRGER